VEAELAQLNRDYDIIRKNYEVMVARRESASLGVKLDESSQLAEFRVVEPPRVSSTPVFPSRLHLALMSLALALAAGVASALALEILRPTYDDAASLLAASGRPVIGTVSLVVTPRAQAQLRSSSVRFAAAAATLLMAQAAWVAWIAAHSRT
jgi:hypothetical protein